MAQALSISRLIRRTINLSPLAAPRRGFGIDLVIVDDDEDIFGENGRLLTYTDIEGVIADHGAGSNAADAATMFFGQTPKPPTIMIGNHIDGDTPLETVTALADISGEWYFVGFATAVLPTVDQDMAVSAFCEAASIPRMYGITSDAAGIIAPVVDPLTDTDIASKLKAAARKHTTLQYSTTQPYAIHSFFGRAASVNFLANRSTINMMWKQEPGVVAEPLTETQANILKTKRANVFAAYHNGTAIVQYGVVSGPAWFDEIHGLDWFNDDIGNELWNLLYGSAKIPQTDAGMEILKAGCARSCDRAVFNGLFAPGVWNADGFGQIERGTYLKSGYYIYAPPISSQAQQDRETRVAPPIQIAGKLAGAFNEADVIININR